MKQKIPPGIYLKKDPDFQDVIVPIQIFKRLTEPLTPESWAKGQKVIIEAAKKFGFMK